MKIKRIGRAIAFAAAALLVSSPAYAHDAVAGEELSGTQEILVISMILLIGGMIICFWAWRQGQFTNIEEPKYTMLKSESALDYSYIESGDEDEVEDEQFIAPNDAPAVSPLAATQYRSADAQQAHS